MRRPASMVTEPNVLPMIDILLVLLVIFILDAVEVVRRAFILQLPQPATRPADASPAIVLTVAAGPRYTINGRDVAPSDLEANLRKTFQDRQGRALFVRGDRGIRYQDVVRAFDAARGAGVPATAIVTSSVPNAAGTRRVAATASVPAATTPVKP